MNDSPVLRVGFDCDGVLYDWHASVRQHLGLDLEQAPNPATWRFHQDWGFSREAFVQAVHAGVDSGVVFGWGEPMTGAREALTRVKAAGHSIHIATDCGGFGTPGVAQASRIKWLTDNDLPFDTITFGSDKTIVDVDCMIDDKLDNYQDLERAGTNAYLFDQPWNRFATDVRRVHSLQEYVNDVLGEWS